MAGIAVRMAWFHPFLDRNFSACYDLFCYVSLHIIWSVWVYRLLLGVVCCRFCYNVNVRYWYDYTGGGIVGSWSLEYVHVALYHTTCAYSGRICIPICYTVVYANEGVLWCSCIFINIFGCGMFFTGSDGVCAFAFCLAYPRWCCDYRIAVSCDRKWTALNSISCRYTLHTLLM